MLCAQTYINTEWVQSTGQPNNINWSASTLDGVGDLIVVANTQISPGVSNVLITKYSSTGEELWQHTYAGSASLNDHGIAVTTDNSGAIYVAATVTNTGNDLDFALLKYSSSGTLIWDATWNGPADLADVPAGLVLDTAGNIYLYGGSWTDPLFADMTLVKFDPTGSEEWSITYDQADLLDAAVGLMFDEYGNPIVFGVSASSALQWDVALLRYNGVSGAGMDTIIQVLPGIGGFQATAMAVDEWGNILVTGGRYNGTNTSLMTLKLSAGFDMLWVVEYDGDGFDDFGEAVVSDSTGNVYVTGYMGNSAGGKEYITLKYDPEGELLWDHVHKRHESAAEATGKRLILSQDWLIVSGTVLNDTLLSFALVGYDHDGELLGVMDHSTPMSDNSVLSMAGGSTSGVVYVSGASMGPNGSSYTTIKYDIYNKENYPVLDSLGTPQYMANEVIVKFRPHVVDTAVVDNKGWQHGILGHIIPDSVQFAIEDRLGMPTGYLDRVKVVKVFRQLIRADSISISRLGEEVRMPKLWSTFIITDASIGEDAHMIADSLSSIWEYVAYAHSNLLFELYSNDPVYGQGWQSSLTPTTEFPDAHINIEQAWAIQTGQPFIKVGIVDTPVNWDHEDFLYGGQTKVLQGWDFFQLPGEVSPQIGSYNGVYGGDGWHGTACASIVGSLRNNETGVAGIAGGDVDGTGNTGTAIVPLIVGRLFEQYITLDAAADAIVQGSSEVPVNGYGLSCHLLNFSWGASVGSLLPEYPLALVDAVLVANSNNCVITAAHGNYGVTQAPFRAYPSAFAEHPDGPHGLVGDNVIISVGATGDDGGHLFFASNNTDGFHFNSCYGVGVDLVAPGSSSNVFSALGGLTPSAPYQLSCQDLPSEPFSNQYFCFQGTSSAAPHVAGVAALMLAEHSVINGAPNGLAPEDVEHILQRSATDVYDLTTGWPPYNEYFVGYDDYHGHGRMDAGAALELVSEPYCVIHSGTPLSTNSQTFTSEVITVPHWNLLELPSGEYNAYKVQVTHTYYDEFAVTAEIVVPQGAWGRESSTKGTHDDVSTVNGRTWATYDFDIDGNTAEVAATTHTWFIQNSTDNNVVVNAWYPAPPGELRTAYSLLVHNGDCWGPSTVDVAETLIENRIMVYPNPASDMLTIELGDFAGPGWQLSIIDALGRSIFSDNAMAPQRTVRMPVAHLKAGTYCVLLRRSDEVHARRFIKLH